jgi:Leucine-rich repeat (LRR) protein
MKRFPALFVILMSVSVHALAQPFTDPKSGGSRPVYRSTRDSIEVAKMEDRWMELMAKPATKAQADSLGSILLAARTKAIAAIKTVYESRYPDVNAAKSMPIDSVKAISLLNAKTWPKELARFTQLEVVELINSPIRNLAALRRFKKLKTVYVLNPTTEKTLRIPKKLPIENLLVRGAAEHFVPRRVTHPKLMRLNLAQNGLTRMPDVADARNLEVLVLRNNQITQFNSYKGNPHLQELELQVNQLTEVPASVGQFSGLKKLVFSANKINQVSPALAKLTQLEQLGFYRNELTAIPEAVYDLPNLRVLDLYYNQIPRVDNRIANWKNLEVLYLSHNQIVSLPDALGQLNQLQELYFHNNRISVLPETLTQLTRLEVLRMNNNLISVLPDDFSSLRLLEYLDLSGNRFSNLPLSIGRFAELEILNLSGNPLDAENLQQWHGLAAQLRQQGIVVNLDAASGPTAEPSR